MDGSSFTTHTHPFNGPFYGTTRVIRYQKGKTNLDFTEARDSEWQWHQLGHMQVCKSKFLKWTAVRLLIMMVVIHSSACGALTLQLDDVPNPALQQTVLGAKYVVST